MSTNQPVHMENWIGCGDYSFGCSDFWSENHLTVQNINFPNSCSSFPPRWIKAYSKALDSVHNQGFFLVVLVSFLSSNMLQAQLKLRGLGKDHLTLSCGEQASTDKWPFVPHRSDPRLQKLIQKYGFPFSHGEEDMARPDTSLGDQGEWA